MANISISSNKDISIVNIDDNMNIFEYYKKSKQADEYGVTNMLTNNVLWNSKLQIINKGKCYIFQIENSLYNIFVGDYIVIDERYRKEATTYERVIRYNSSNNAFRYHQMEHDKSGSTSNVRYYDSDESKNSKYSFSREQVTKLIDEMLTKIIDSNKAKDITDVELMKENILSSLNDNSKTYEIGSRGAK
jgi:hypothetical protein